MTIYIANTTSLPHFRFAGSDSRGRMFGVLMVKGAWDIGDDGECYLAAEQEPFNFSDRYHGALNATSLRHPSDLVPYKPGTDIIFDAVAHSPDGGSRTDWQASVHARDAEGQVVGQRLRVTGPRQWVPRFSVPPRLLGAMSEEKRRQAFLGWTMSEAEPVTAVPIRYEFAYGGIKADPSQEAYEFNPLGRGLIDERYTPVDRPVGAPQIEALSEPIEVAGRHYRPAGLGPIPPAWLPRRPLGGTYDDHWKEHVWPNWAEDYDYAFHQSAHPDLVSSSPLQGDISIALENLRPEATRKAFTLVLKDPRPVARFETADGKRFSSKMKLDTLFVDIAQERIETCSVQSTWRIVFDEQVNQTITVQLSPKYEIAAGAGDPLSPPPCPDDIAAFPLEANR